MKIIYREYVEIATGSAECTKTKNIYDLAGNMWKWTTEHGRRTVGDPEIDATLNIDYAVHRGGGLYGSGMAYPVCYRGCNRITDSFYEVVLGFRVVLYVI